MYQRNMVDLQSITVEEYNSGPPSFRIVYGCPPTPFGKCFLGLTQYNNEVLHLSFPPLDTAKDRQQETMRLQKLWSMNELVEDSTGVTDEVAEKIFNPKDDRIPVYLKGTEFQLKVWLALLDISPGTRTTYQEVAQSIGNPGAARAVGGAVMRNQVGYLIPCHRVMSKSGSDKYSWGPELKRRILDYEIDKKGRLKKDI